MEMTIVATRTRDDSAPWLDTLPSGAFSTLSSFLLGVDLLKLTDVSPRLRGLIDVASYVMWRSRLIDYFTGGENEYQCTSMLKKQTVNGRSLQLRGTQKESSGRGDQWSCVRIDVDGLALAYPR